jgi:hypothetical protein
VTEERGVRNSGYSERPVSGCGKEP